MKIRQLRWLWWIWCWGWAATAAVTPSKIPEVLRPWEAWATWDDTTRFCPTPYSNPDAHQCFWPSQLDLHVGTNGASFELQVMVYAATWVPLPGGTDLWPGQVQDNTIPVAVLPRDGIPAVRLEPGRHLLTGSYRWADFPQRIAIPPAIGILSLILEGRPVANPVWDAEGQLWLKREGLTGPAEENFLSVKLYSLLEDGIPLWLRQEIELTVSGQSREEDLGGILPEGWRLASVSGPLPVAVDEAGRAKVQVRAGKWTLRLEAFRFDDPKEYRFAAGVTPAVAEELVAFRARPDFRVLEIGGATSIDVSQTTFPEKWRELPVFRWDTTTPFRLEQRMRGRGDQKPEGLSLAREWWLDEDGKGLTFRDRITGSRQEIWRLDVAEGEELGSVQSQGVGQLITENPQNGAPGVEIRKRDLNLEATGRMTRAREYSATGWRTDADSLQVSLNLPPGWRLFALFGADWVQGDWLTAWTLLDLFLLLIFSMTVFRLWGFRVAVLAFLAFGLAYHEPGAPRYLWLFLLIPLALQRVVPEGWARKLVQATNWTAMLLLFLALAPFVARQIQQAIYPQLEIVSAGRLLFAPQRYTVNQVSLVENAPASGDTIAVAKEVRPELARRYGLTSPSLSNLSYDSKARIQTGPGVPEWSWRAVRFGWNGPVQASQQVRPILISLTGERIFTLLRVALLLALAALLFRAGSRSRTPGGTVSKAAVLGALMFLPLFFTPAQAAESEAPAIVETIPDAATLAKLRERLLAPSDAFPNAASISSVRLSLRERRINMLAEIHTAVLTSVPLPGRLPAWSPLRVLVDGKPETALRREDGFLWVVLPAGVHQVQVEGLLAAEGDWQWTFHLKPHQVSIDAPGWTVSGVRPNGVPEQQVFFAPVQKASASQVSYERQEFQAVAQVERQFELGLVWQVRTKVTRLSPAGRAVALRVPLLPGENVLSANAVVQDGGIEVRLGAQEPSFEWTSGLTVSNQLVLTTRTNDTWVERWQLVASPVWNVALTGLPPLFEANESDLVPVWQPWPGESVTLSLSRPVALGGATITVDKGTHSVQLGRRQRVSELVLALRCSLGEDFLVTLPDDAEITSLTRNGEALPVRKDGPRVIIPVRPGAQTVKLGWKVNTPLGLRAGAGAVQLPVESANVETIVTVPSDRWVLWASGPQQGPAVRFWVILICSLLAAIGLARIKQSPLSVGAWMLLVIGLTQVPLLAGLVVVGWLFVVTWRGRPAFQELPEQGYLAGQALLVMSTVVSVAILIFAVGEGLLGSPEMFILGNGSTREVLRWYQDRNAGALPVPQVHSVSVWWFRFLMLLWALWLAASLIRWLRLAWVNFSLGGFRPTSPAGTVSETEGLTVPPAPPGKQPKFRPSPPPPPPAL